MKLVFSRQIFEKLKISSFIEMRPVGAGLYHADGQTDRQVARNDDLIVAFRNFANAPENKNYNFFIV